MSCCLMLCHDRRLHRLDRRVDPLSCSTAKNRRLVANRVGRVDFNLGHYPLRDLVDDCPDLGTYRELNRIAKVHLAVPHPQTWLRVVPGGLYCEPGDFFIDPTSPVDRAVVTHGHSDHARAGNKHVLAPAETLAIMQARYGEDSGGSLQAVGYGEAVTINTVSVTLVPAGHVLGGAQAG